MTDEDLQAPAEEEEAPGGNGGFGSPPDTSPTTALDDSNDEPAEVGGEEAEESPLEAAERERDEYLDLAQRARAEFENYKKRSAGDVRAAELRGRGGLARDLVPTMDNLERALLAAGVDPAGGEAAAESPSEEVSAHRALAEGVALVYRELKTTLERAGVEAYEPSGERFDPLVHEAVATNPVEGVDGGLIIETIEKGYRLGDNVLRPARVIVSA